MTFAEYQKLATEVPAFLRNNRDRIDLPVLGLQNEAGRIGKLLDASFASGKLNLTREQSRELQDRLSDILWHIALVCTGAGVALEDVAANSAALLKIRSKDSDPNER
jgi:prephenate dehydratase